MELFERIKHNPGPLGKWADLAEGYFIFPKLDGALSNRMHFKGKEVVVWSINNYLGLGNDPIIRKADEEAVKKWGLAYPMGSRMMTGNTDLHDKLEAELAAFVHEEEAILLNYGYQGIMSAIDALLGRHDIVVYDAECHACIVDGVRLHQGKRLVYAHNDIHRLKLQLERATRMISKDENRGSILVITEGVFGMRGDQGKLKEIVALKEQYDFRLMVDDAHGFGTLGATGAGAGEEQGVQDGIDIYFATFAKSLASIGAFIAGNKYLINFLKYNTRSQIFAKSLPMPIVEGALKRLELLKQNPKYRNELWHNVRQLQSRLKENGFNIGATNSCVTPVYLEGTIPEAMNLVRDLRENFGIFCSIVVYPVVPKGVILLRLIPTAVHTEEDIEKTMEAFKAISTKLKSGAYESNVAQH